MELVEKGRREAEASLPNLILLSLALDRAYGKQQEAYQSWKDALDKLQGGSEGAGQNQDEKLIGCAWGRKKWKVKVFPCKQLTQYVN